MALTPDQLAARQHFLGGTDMAALAGVSPWAQPIDVFHDKRPDLAPPRPDRTSTAMTMGSLLEPVVAALFTQATGTRLRRLPRPVRCRLHPWEGASLDRRGADGSVFEAKWSTARTGWGDPGTYGPAQGDPPIPHAYYVQVQWYLHVTQAPVAHLGALLGYGEFRHYTLAPDLDLQASLVELAYAFWHYHVEPGVPPPPDGSEAYSRAVRQRYAQDDGTTAVATPHQQALLGQLRTARAALHDAAQAAAQVEQALQLSMGPITRLDAPGAAITWRATSPKPRPEWRLVAQALAPSPDALAAAASTYTTTATASRPFLVSFDE